MFKFGSLLENNRQIKTDNKEKHSRKKEKQTVRQINDLAVLIILSSVRKGTKGMKGSAQKMVPIENNSNNTTFSLRSFCQNPV